MQIASFYVIFLIKCFTQDDGCLLHNPNSKHKFLLPDREKTVTHSKDPFKPNTWKCHRLSPNLYNDDSPFITEIKCWWWKSPAECFPQKPKNLPKIASLQRNDVCRVDKWGGELLQSCCWCNDASVFILGLFVNLCRIDSHVTLTL